MYDGRVSSTHFSVFEVSLQESIHAFYSDILSRRYTELPDTIDVATDDVNASLTENESGLLVRIGGFFSRPKLGQPRRIGPGIHVPAVPRFDVCSAYTRFILPRIKTF